MSAPRQPAASSPNAATTPAVKTWCGSTTKPPCRCTACAPPTRKSAACSAWPRPQRPTTAFPTAASMCPWPSTKTACGHCSRSTMPSFMCCPRHGRRNRCSTPTRLVRRAARGPPTPTPRCASAACNSAVGAGRGEHPRQARIQHVNRPATAQPVVGLRKPHRQRPAVEHLGQFNDHTLRPRPH